MHLSFKERMLALAFAGTLAVPAHALVETRSEQPLPRLDEVRVGATVVVPGVKPRRLPMLAAEAPGPVDPLVRAELRERAGHGHVIDRRREGVLDPAVFTELSPVTADETPVKLPDDQALE